MLSCALVELGQAHYKNFNSFKYPARLHIEGIRLDLISI